MNSKMICASFAPLMLLAGCGTPVPNVQYREFPCKESDVGSCSTSPDSLARFTLPKTLVVITSKNGKQGAEADALIASVLKAESTKKTYEMLQDDPWGETTYLTYTKVDGTNTFNDLNVSVSDDRSKEIATWGGVIVSAVKLVGTAGLYSLPFKLPGIDQPSPDKPVTYLVLPLEIDTESLINKVTEENMRGQGDKASAPTRGGEVTDYIQLKAGPTKTSARFNAVLGPVPRDSILMDKYIENSKGIRKNEFVTSACRKLKIAFTDGTSDPRLKDKAWDLVVADPNYVEVIKFAAKSGIKSRASCGMDVTPGAATNDSATADIASALSTQAGAIADAVKALEDARKKAD
ncbi:MAG: hypothetical protein ACNJA3_28030 (plasmid) [Pseudomonas rhizophila]|uniref:hypothetical protein n=1 Tax=Pseudomonas rhizophila TaxID=2045200 RepID=UPI003F6BCFC8